MSWRLKNKPTNIICDEELKKRKNENEKIKRVWEISQGLLITKKTEKDCSKKKIGNCSSRNKTKKKNKSKGRN